MSYTKGPWLLSEVDNVYVYIPHSKLPYYLRVLPEESNVADSEDYANANLIAAAPELVEALETAKRALDRLAEIDQIYLNDTYAQIVKALTNAKGGQP